MTSRITLILILLFAAGLRFFQLGQNPPGLYWDEVSLGYNAYSILTTGRDEHGEWLPLTRFKAFGDYNPPGYIYATVPSIALFGLNEFAVRFPSALFGSLTVLLTYFLVKEISKNRLWALLSALILAAMPWHVHFSRAAFETNVSVFWVALGSIFFFRFVKSSKNWQLIISLT